MGRVSHTLGDCMGVKDVPTVAFRRFTSPGIAENQGKPTWHIRRGNATEATA